jgi:hypothetical protein
MSVQSIMDKERAATQTELPVERKLRVARMALLLCCDHFRIATLRHMTTEEIAARYMTAAEILTL